jgi:hypothetical protein
MTVEGAPLWPVSYTVLIPRPGIACLGGMVAIVHAFTPSILPSDRHRASHARQVSPTNVVNAMSMIEAIGHNVGLATL